MKKIIGIVALVIVGILLIIPRPKLKENTASTKGANQALKLTNGPNEINELLKDNIEIKAMSADMGNVISFTLNELITQNEATGILNKDYGILENIKSNIQNLKEKYPNELKDYGTQSINIINNLEQLNKKAIPNVEAYNTGNLKEIEGEISSSFKDSKNYIGEKYKINEQAYNEVLAEQTYGYNFTKNDIS